jgi:hypothetical protein
MTKKKTKEKPSTLDQLTELRKDIVGENAVTRLIDILIDHHDGDAEAVRQETADALAEHDAAVAAAGHASPSAPPVEPGKTEPGG